MISFKKILHHIFSFLFNLFGKTLSPSAFNTIFEFFKFGLVGISNTLISYSAYVVIWILLQKVDNAHDYDYLIAQICSFVLGVLWSFYWNNKFVFNRSNSNKRAILISLCKTFVSYSFTGIFLNSILLFIWIKWFHISGLIAPLLNLIVSVPVNFILNKFWSFK